MFTQRPSFRFLTIGALVSFTILTIILLQSSKSRNLSSQYILKATRPGSHCPPPLDIVNSTTTPHAHEWEFRVDRDGNNHGLSDEQCRSAFPKLFNELDKSAALRSEEPISYAELRGREVDDGMVRGTGQASICMRSCRVLLLVGVHRIESTNV